MRIPVLYFLSLLVSVDLMAGERVSFNDGWVFAKGEQAAAEKVVFNDTGWRAVQLPHDWAIEGPFDEQYNARAGGLPFHGIGWYRKTFEVPGSARGKVLRLQFDGAMNNSEVWINGQYLGKRPFGYIGFEYDLTPYLKIGQANTVAVKLSPVDFSTRWYPGAGIYRNVWLVTSDPVHIPRWGTYITTPAVLESNALVQIQVDVQKPSALQEIIRVETTILDPTGNEVGKVTTPIGNQFSQQAQARQQVRLKNPQLWGMESPVLYTAVTRLLKGKKELDKVSTRFGIRTIHYSRKNGFLLNGEQVRFNGVCLHHDNGPLGAVVNRRAIERKLQIMKTMGVNSVRTSHNPPSPELVELCDEMGILLQVEAFDCWAMEKKGAEQAYNLVFDEWHERDLRDMVRSFHNSPSVVMWSIGNEIMEQGKQDGWKVAKMLTDIVHDQDNTRPVTAGFNNHGGAIKNGLADVVDLVGFNYKPALYKETLAEHPDWILYGSETSSCTSTRGEYHLPWDKYETHESLRVTSYDFIGPNWAVPPDYEFFHQEDNPAILGEFIWTGFDYIGEPTPYGGRDHSTNGYWNGHWPSRSSSFGAVDLCGFPKDRYFLYQSQWTSEPMVHVLPHWNWEGREGQTIPVLAYSNCEEVELFVNGQSAGRQVKGEQPVTLPMGYRFLDAKTWDSPYRMRWNVPYKAGSLKVVGYKDGKAVSEKVIQTAGKPAKVTLLPDRTGITADGYDLSYVTVRVEDKNGNLCPLADNLVNFNVTGAGEIAAVGNGNSATTEPFQASYRKAFNGLAMLIIRSKRDAGEIQISATSDGLKAGSAKLVTR